MTVTDIDSYLDEVSEPGRKTLTELRHTLRELLPTAEECISYAVPGFRVRGKVIAGFAAYTSHLSYFPHSGRVLSALSDRLTGYDWSAGTLRFPLDRPLPRDLVSALVAEKMRQTFGAEQS